MSEYYGDFPRIPIRQVFLTAAIRAVRYWSWRMRSQNWQVAQGTVEAREWLSLASNAGWTRIQYSYQVGKELFFGDARGGFISRKNVYAERDPAMIEFFSQLPEGAPVRVLFDPRKPSRSVLVLGSQ
jgi:hypothetical protein